jgi:hypothetical protein
MAPSWCAGWRHGYNHQYTTGYNGANRSAVLPAVWVAHRNGRPARCQRFGSSVGQERVIGDLVQHRMQAKPPIERRR